MKKCVRVLQGFKEVLVIARPACLLPDANPQDSHEDDRAAYGKQSHKTIESVFVFPANLVAARRE